MKKIVITGAILALTTSAIADDFYIKAGVIGGMGHKLDDSSKFFTKIEEQKTISVDKKDIYGDFHFGGGLGFGYKLMDNVRFEIQGAYLAGPNYEYKLKKVNNTDTLDSETLKLQRSGFVGLAAAYVDVVDMGAAKFFVGGGLGVSYMDATVGKFGGKFGNNTVSQSEVKIKKDFGLAWKVEAGVGFEMSPGVSLDVSYSLMGLGNSGKNEKYTDINKQDIAEDKQEYKDLITDKSMMTHNINVGVRFSM